MDTILGAIQIKEGEMKECIGGHKLKTIIVLIVLLSSGMVFGEEDTRWMWNAIPSGPLSLPTEGAKRSGQILTGNGTLTYPFKWVDESLLSLPTAVNDYSSKVVFEIFSVSLPKEYPNTELTETNVFVEFPDMYGKYSIKDIKEALKKDRK